ncbi:MAG: hypothetical protein K2L98_00550 [Bacilli bacterium]|nr:hypothetical protein [Bacilli bacterium]
MMKIQKERKPFKREYIPIILAVLILFLLVGALIYLIGHDFKFEEETVDPNQHEQQEVLIDNSNSRCSKDQLNELYKIAENIKVNTEMIEIEDTENMVFDQENDVFIPGISVVPVIKFDNLDPKVYIFMSNDYNSKTEEIKSEKKNVEMNGIHADKIVEYTIEVRANDYDCKGDAVRKFTVKTPIYNSFSEMDVCVDYPDYEYCKEYIAEDLPTMHDFQLGLQKYKKTLKTTVTPKFTDESTPNDKTNQVTTTSGTVDKKEEKKDNKTIIYIIIGAIVLLVGVAIVTLILIKKKRSKEV